MAVALLNDILLLSMSMSKSKKYSPFLEYISESIDNKYISSS